MVALSWKRDDRANTAIKVNKATDNRDGSLTRRREEKQGRAATAIEE